ncbi:MAG: hypothetical protein U0326_44040 [Polyangiales bacterium]
MALPKHARRITVDGEAYRWLVSTSALPGEVRAIVQHEGGRGPKLCARFAAVHIARTQPDGSVAHPQSTVVSSAFVRDAIRHARDEGWDPLGDGPDVAVRYDDGFRDPDGAVQRAPQRVALDPLVERVVCNAPGSTGPTAAWTRYWSRGGRDPLTAAWEASSNPGVMFDVLSAALPAARHAVERAFAERSGPVAAMFERNPPDAPRSIRGDLDALVEAAGQSVRGEYAGALHHELILRTDVGTAGDWNRFCAEVSEVIRALVATPPTTADLERG